MLRTFPVVLLETMSHYTDEPRFTIEQIDLLQRLRRTGMTRHEILHALETLDRLDQEHSDKFGRRSSYGGGSYSNSTNNVPASSSTATASTQTQHSGMSPSPSNSYDTSPQPCTTNQNGRESNERLSAFNGKMSPTRYPLANSLAQRSYSFEASEEDLDIDDKVEELMRRDSSVIKEEIKAFLANRRISQAVVAQVTGISQSRISHWLLQQGSDLSEQKKRAFYRWYQLEKTNPGATLSMRPAPIPIEEPEWRQTPPPVTATSGTFRLRRGSRFTWRKECLAVMESYFNENQYPDEAKREEIANACNAVIQKPGEELIAMSFPKAITIRFEHLLLNSVNVILWLLLIIQHSQLVVGFFSSLLSLAFFRAANTWMNTKVSAIFKPKYLYLKLKFLPVEIRNTRCIFHVCSFVNDVAKKINMP
uniref:Homeobox containing 1 n=1 Tax=Coturnix japonica TaxID=93934 RepID=A0A8C2TPA7_COTJA